MRVHRTLLIRRRIDEFGEFDREALLSVLPRLDALGNLWARGFSIYPPGMARFVHEFDYFRNEVRLIAKAWFARVHAILSVGVRISNERDGGEGVFIDLASGVLRLRGFVRRKSIIINLAPGEVEYIRDRLSEGGRPKIARAWLDGGVLNIAIVFERDAEPMRVGQYGLVVDVNSWRYGIVWALVRDSRITSLGRCRPNLGRLERLYAEVVRLEEEYGRLRRLGLDKSTVGRRLWRRVRQGKRRLYAIVRDYAQWLASKLARKALRYGALVIIDDIIEESRRELLEESLGDGLAKLYLVGLRRFVRLFTNQLAWYGVPYVFRRLPSTVCPVCGHGLVRVGRRIMECPHCGFREDRDRVPMYWALKLLSNQGTQLV